MERDGLIIRELAFKTVKVAHQLPCGYDMQEQIQRAGTELFILFSELYEAASLKWSNALAEVSLKKAIELKVLIGLNQVESVNSKMIDELILTLKTYCAGGGKFRKFARKNTGRTN